MSVVRTVGFSFLGCVVGILVKATALLWLEFNIPVIVQDGNFRIFIDGWIWFAGSDLVIFVMRLAFVATFDSDVRR